MKLNNVTPHRWRRLASLVAASVLTFGLLAAGLPVHASEPSVAVPLRQIYMAPPELTGEPTVGGLLKADLSWTTPTVVPEGGSPALSFQWTRDGQVIRGATGQTYRATMDDYGTVVTAFVTVTYDAESVLTLQARESLRIAAKPRARGFNGDSTLDMFARDTSGRLWLYPTDGRGHWQPAQVIGTGWNAFNHLFSPGDFDNDGTVDVMARDSQGRLFLYQGNGSGGWKKALQVGQGWQGFNAIFGAGDFNGDGTNDVMARDASGNLVLYPGNGRGGWLASYTVGWNWGSYDNLMSANHFQGRSDLVIAARGPYGFLRSFESPRNGWFDRYAGWALGTGWDAVGPIGSAGDFNGDDKTDVFAIDKAGNLNMYYGNGADYLATGLPGNIWKGQSVVGWGWGGFTAVF
ncbi:FG-GAP repeat domain-containing protein [Paenarthrobacter sp. NCHU4564]|uniref:FG-GAP repeat domain-containing protein n=1 Tax=Paenarthrobacter sp. NCHU4564 TaxID=3451353 RepID=UPI003F95D095